MLGGWFQVAYERDLVGDLTPADVGDVPVALVVDGDRLRAVEAVCPHRGAHLGFGGTLRSGAIVCPFHGHAVAIGLTGDDRFCVRELAVLGYGGMVFVRLSDDNENGLSAYLDRVAETHVFVPGFTLGVRCRPSLVIENAFDGAHFRPVHGLSNQPLLEVRPSEHGEFAVEGEFEVPIRTRTDAPPASAHFVARAFSPNLVVSELEGDLPYTVITAATPSAGGGSSVRVSLAVPKGPDGPLLAPDVCTYLLDHSREGIRADAVIWEHLTELDHPRYTARDESVVGFAAFCERFRT